MRSRSIVATALFVLASACEPREAPRGDSSSGAQPVHVTRKPAADDLAPATCGTLRDVVTSDLVRLEGELLHHVDESEGYAITNVENPSRPRTVARVPFVGAPLALHVRGSMAWIAYVDWNVPGALTVVKAVDIEHPDAVRVIGTVARSGVATGTALVGGVLYVMNAKDGATALAAYRVANDRLSLVDELSIAGAPAALAASPAGLATVTTMRGETSASWVDLSVDRPGAMTMRGERRLPGGFPAWERDIVDADEAQAVRFLACATAGCPDGGDAIVRVVDFANGADDVRALLPVRIGAGVPIARFSGDRLYVASDGTLRVVALHPAPRVVGSVALPGTVAALRPVGSRVVAIGSVGAPLTGVRVAVHDVDVGVAWQPRLRGTATFGEDWTWSRASDDDRAISVDPTGAFVAIPFSTWRASDGRYATGAQLFGLRSGAPALGAALPADGHVERVVFVEGRVLAVGGGEVKLLERASERELEVR